MINRLQNFHVNSYFAKSIQFDSISLVDSSYDHKSNIYVMELEEKKKSVQEYEEDYDPYVHRNVTHPTT